MAAVDAAYLDRFGEVKDLLSSYSGSSEPVVNPLFPDFVEEHSVNQRDPFGDTILHAAAANGNILLVRYLVGLGADVNAVNNAGSTPLHKACSGVAPPSSALAVVKFLLEAGADPLIANKAGLLPEDYARFDLSLVTALMGDKTASDEIIIPKAKHGFIIGRNGATREEIQMVTRTTVIIPPPTQPSEAIRIIGRKENIAACKEKIKQIADEKDIGAEKRTTAEKSESGARGANRGAKTSNAESAPAPVTVKYPLPRERHPVLIGRDGARIKSIRAQSGAKITIPNKTEMEDSIFISGTREAVDKAMELIRAALAENKGGRPNQSGNAKKSSARKAPTNKETKPSNAQRATRQNVAE